jgi:hypothetical protein
MIWPKWMLEPAAADPGAGVGVGAGFVPGGCGEDGGPGLGGGFGPGAGVGGGFGPGAGVGGGFGAGGGVGVGGGAPPFGKEFPEFTGADALDEMSSVKFRPG